MFTVRPAAVSSSKRVCGCVCVYVKAREVFAVVVVVDVVIVLGTRCTQQLLCLVLSVAAAVCDGPTGCCGAAVSTILLRR